MSGFYDFFLIPDDFFTEFLKSPPNTATSPNQIGKQVSFTKTSLQNQARHAPGCGAESAGGHALCSSTGTFNSAVLIQKFLLSSILGFTVWCLHKGMHTFSFRFIKKCFQLATATNLATAFCTVRRQFCRENHFEQPNETKPVIIKPLWGRPLEDMYIYIHSYYLFADPLMYYVLMYFI